MKKLDNDTFIDVEEFAKLVGLAKSGLSKNTMLTLAIEKLRKNKVITVYSEENHLYFNKNEVKDFLSKVTSFNNVINDINKGPQTLRKLIRENNIKHYDFGPTYDQRFIPNTEIRNYISDENLINGYELIKKLGLAKNHRTNNFGSLYKKTMERIKQNQDLKLILGYKNLKHPLFFKKQKHRHYDVFMKQTVINFINDHISLKKMMQEFDVSRSNLQTLLSSKNVSVYPLMSNPEFQFINLKDYNFIKDYMSLVRSGVNPYFLTNDEFIRMKLDNQTFTNIEVMRKLKLKSDHNFDEILSIYKIYPIKTIDFADRSVNFYPKTEINRLVHLQKELKEYYSTNYYTLTQIEKKYKKLSYKSIIYRSNIQATECPLILRAIFNTHALYEKTEIDNLLKKREQDLEINSVEMNSPYSEFIYKSEIVLNSSFSDKTVETKKLWYQYVKNKLMNSTSHNIQRYINQLSRLSYLLSNVLTKEIYEYSSSTLNNIFFNEKSDTFNITYQSILYDFYTMLIRSLENKVGKTFFQSHLINNPNNFSKKRVVDTSRYTFEEYKDLYNYATDLTIHKARAIEDAISFLHGKSHIKYDSYWVYILTHLTNNWRHSTIITELPQVDLSNTSIKNLDWLMDNNISIQDANSIIFQLGLSLKNISKTGAKTEFRIAEPLKISFATAVSICQLRSDFIEEKNTKNQLLDLNKSYVIQPHYSLHKEFFRHFKYDFKFSNRKMNKTLTTLIWSVFKELNVAQVSRSHFNESTTLNYIKLSKQQLYSIVNKLFENDSFGYIYQLLTQSLFDTDVQNKELKFKGISAIKKQFGDVQKIEISTGLVNKLAEENNDIKKLVNELSPEEKQEILLNSMTNTLYSKQKYYQCVFSECKFKGQSISLQDCSNCPYSIINVYALSNLMSLYIDSIYQIINKFESAKIGEKQKMANHFYLLWRQIQNAKEKFGDSVYEFVEGGKERFFELSHVLPKTKAYLTITET